MLRNIGSNVGRNLLNDRSSACVLMYHVKWSFEPHDIDGIGCDSYEYEAHGVEVEGSPAMFEEHI